MDGGAFLLKLDSAGRHVKAPDAVGIFIDKLQRLDVSVLQPPHPFAQCLGVVRAQVFNVLNTILLPKKMP